MKKILFLLVIGLIVFSGCISKEGEKVMAAGFFNSETNQALGDIPISYSFVCENPTVEIKTDKLAGSALLLTMPPGCGKVTVTAEAEGFSKKTEIISEDAKKAEIMLDPLK
jgi:hypothetical protein